MTGKTKTLDRCLPPEPHVLADAVPEALKQFLRPVTATQEAVLGAAVEKAACTIHRGTKAEILKMLHHSPVPEVRAAKASWVTVTQRRIVIRMPLRQAKGEARFVLDRKAAAATLRRLWKKHGTMIVGALMGYVKP